MVDWNLHGFHVLDCLPKGQKCDAGYVISNRLPAILETFPVREDDGDRKSVILADNARPHAARLVQNSCDESFIQMASPLPIHMIWGPRIFGFSDISKGC
jgi:hypothetical protein